MVLGRTSSQCFPTDDFGTRFASDCRNLHVSVGSGNSASIQVMHSDHATGCWTLIFCTHTFTCTCFFLSGTRGPLLRSVLNCRDEKHLLQSQ